MRHVALRPTEEEDPASPFSQTTIDVALLVETKNQDDVGLTPSQKESIESIHADSGMTEEQKAKLFSSFAKLEAALDTDKSGHVSAREMDEGLAMLQKLRQAQANHSAEIDYSMMPAVVQVIRATWDTDGSKTVSCVELAAVAAAWKKTQKENKVFKKIIAVMAVVLLLLLLGIFGLSYATAELAKDIRPGEGGTLKTTHGDVVQDEVRELQAKWADAIKTISRTFLNNGDYVATAAAAAGELYGYGHGSVLFKPTKAAAAQFRPTAADAMSYFVGHQAVDGGYPEDAGFAINGGKGWSNVEFENNQIERSGNVAIAMGNYYFTSAEDGSRTKVEYTFGYRKNEDGKARIFLHHSSVPYGA